MQLIKNLTYEHQDELWFSYDEIKSFKLETARILRAIMRANSMTMAQYAVMNADDTSVFLGLEKYITADTPKKIRAATYNHKMMVLYEQERQCVAGIHNAEELARVSQEASRWCWHRSQIIAQIHAR